LASVNISSLFVNVYKDADVVVVATTFNADDDDDVPVLMPVFFTDVVVVDTEKEATPTAEVAAVVRKHAVAAGTNFMMTRSKTVGVRVEVSLFGVLPSRPW
jgi:hypothetical protein